LNDDPLGRADHQRAAVIDERGEHEIVAAPVVSLPAFKATLLGWQGGAEF
jgi:hypothetical protein